MTFTLTARGVNSGYTLSGDVIDDVDETELDPGDDEIHGGAGADTIYGEAGDDTLYGDNGDDDIYGGEGNDTSSGGQGQDEIEGGLGDDVISGGSGDDTISGGAGDDTPAPLDPAHAVVGLLGAVHADAELQAGPRHRLWRVRATADRRLPVRRDGRRGGGGVRSGRQVDRRRRGGAGPRCGGGRGRRDLRPAALYRSRG